ncbi:unnamed protein product [Rotaria sordida]|uniref:TIR domain-containing protein n=2 Tax=Rotaria sordida TaxID=392033 RepID=A0A819QIP4_9BILA|nr:unnamed protein product [Rotaria sordida]
MGCNSSLPTTTVKPLDQAMETEQRKSQVVIAAKNDPIISDMTDNKALPKPAAITQVNENKKHIMLSYQHANQALVLNVYEFLKSHQVRVWMDVKGGMGEHLLDSMAAAVQNSAAVVCFLTQKYQDSQNCKEEFKYARKKNKPMIPCLINPGWKPDGWLDMGINDLLYIDFKKTTENNFQLKCEELLEKIKQVVKTEDYFMTEDDISTVAKAADAVAELEEEPNYDVVNVDYTSKIPSGIHEGPEIKIENVDSMKITKHICEGNSAVRLLLTGNSKDRYVHANQDLFDRNGKFLNYFFIPKLVFQNTSKDPISILEMTGKYKNSEGNWCDCEDVKIGPPVSDDAAQYHWLPDTTVNLKPLKLTTFAVRVDVQVHGKSGLTNEHRSRAHKSLPQPFKIRLHLHDTEGKTVSLIVEQVNDPLVLPTKERIIEQFGYEDVIAFVYADDCEEDKRHWVAVYYEDKTKLRFSFGDSLYGCTTQYLDTWLIKKLYNEAKKTASAEIVLNEWNDDCRTMTALFDQETFILFGVRIELRTQTSKTIETILLPLDQIKERFAIESEDVIVFSGDDNEEDKGNDEID